MTVFGYARASISQPSLDPQIDILSRHGVRTEHLFTDALAGRRAERHGLQGLQGAVRPRLCAYLGRAAALATASAVMLSTRRTVAAGVRM